jgi:hypothetical protein
MKLVRQRDWLSPDAIAIDPDHERT